MSIKHTGPPGIVNKAHRTSLNIPTPTPAPDQGGPVACRGGPVATPYILTSFAFGNDGFHFLDGEDH